MKLLHIDSSILGDNSASRQLSREVPNAFLPTYQLFAVPVGFSPS
ncbi:hypothetical protein [Pseudomonas hunanensis]|nr:FMN-dependent NADH-azoreductase [Pseudomonas hunanensis]